MSTGQESGDPGPNGSVAVSRILRKRDLLRRQDPSHASIRTALLVEGGGMRGAYAGGVTVGLQTLGLTDAFDCVVGVSAGAASSAYFLGCQAEVGASLYYQELASRRFISFLRPTRILNIDYLDQCFRHIKPLDVERIRSSRSRFFVAVTNVQTAGCELLDIGDPSIDIASAICASAALPVVYPRAVRIKGREYRDGATACGLPIDFLVDQCRCTDVLVVLNRPYENKGDTIARSEALATRLIHRQLPSAYVHAHLTRNGPYNRAMERIRGYQRTGSAINIHVICPEAVLVGALSTDRTSLRQAAQSGVQHALEAFGGGRALPLPPGWKRNPTGKPILQ